MSIIDYCTVHDDLRDPHWERCRTAIDEELWAEVEDCSIKEYMRVNRRRVNG